MTKFEEYQQLFAEQGYITKQQAWRLLTLKQIQAHIQQYDQDVYETVVQKASIWKNKQQLLNWVDCGRYERLNQKMAKRPGFGGRED